MNVSKMLRLTRKVSATVTVVAVTCVVSVNTTSATAGHAEPSVTQATKEWKTAPSSTNEVVLATKKWKADPFRTKEW